MADYQMLMTDARAQVAAWDQRDHDAGFGAPTDDLRQALMATAAALRAGIMTDDWTCVAEALVMLEQHGVSNPD